MSPKKRPKTKRKKRPAPTLENASIQQLQEALERADLGAKAARAQTRHRLAAIGRDLTPTAASLARKGRPRLLATIAKMSTEDKSEKQIAKRVADELERRYPKQIILRHHVARPQREYKNPNVKPGEITIDVQPGDPPDKP